MGIAEGGHASRQTLLIGIGRVSGIAMLQMPVFAIPRTAYEKPVVPFTAVSASVLNGSGLPFFIEHAALSHANKKMEVAEPQFKY